MIVEVVAAVEPVLWAAMVRLVNVPLSMTSFRPPVMRKFEVVPVPIDVLFFMATVDESLCAPPLKVTVLLPELVITLVSSTSARSSMTSPLVAAENAAGSVS